MFICEEIRNKASERKRAWPPRIIVDFFKISKVPAQAHLARPSNYWKFTTGDVFGDLGSVWVPGVPPNGSYHE